MPAAAAALLPRPRPRALAAKAPTSRDERNVQFCERQLCDTSPCSRNRAQDCLAVPQVRAQHAAESTHQNADRAPRNETDTFVAGANSLWP
jgi:hypothetical protein